MMFSLIATALREIVKEMANTLPPEPETTQPAPKPVLYDPDIEMHRREEDEEFKDTDQWEDLSTYMDQYT